MVKKLFTIGAIIGCMLPAVALADKYGLSDTAKYAELPTQVAGQSTVEEAAGTLIQVLLGFLGIVFFFLIFYAGIRWMTARGNEENITKAKDTMEAAVIGVVLVLAAYAIASFVLTALTKDTTQQQLAAPESETCESNLGGACVGPNDPLYQTSCDTIYRAAKNCKQDEICCKAK